MRGSERQVTEERTVLVFLDEAKGFVHDRVLGVGSAGTPTVITGKMNLLAIAYQIRWIKTMGMDLIVVSEEYVETVFFRYARGIPATASPLSEASRGIAFFLEERGYGFFFGPEWGSSIIGPYR